MQPESRVCTKCTVEKPLTEFSKAPRGKYGVKASCKACDAARHREQHPLRPRKSRPRRAPIDPATERECTRCKSTKPYSAFSLSRQPTATRNAVYRSHCKECQASAARQWFASNQERSNENRRRYNLKTNYGLTVAQYDALLRAQGGVCAICGQSERVRRQGKLLRMPVDHDHATGAVRGLLCLSCNRALGLLGDNAIVLRRAISYLLRHRTNSR